MPEHDIAPLGERHALHNWEYTDAAARTGATGFIPSDVSKWAKQLDNGTYWELTDDSPVTWAQRTGAGAATDTEAVQDIVGALFSDGAVDFTYDDGGAVVSNVVKTVIALACSDEVTPIVAAAPVATFRMPHAMTLTAVRGSLTGAAGSGTFTVDIKENGTTILSTLLTIDATEKTSTTAATPAVISDSALADDAEITIEVTDDAAGDATGLKIYLIGTRS